LGYVPQCCSSSGHCILSRPTAATAADDLHTFSCSSTHTDTDCRHATELRLLLITYTIIIIITTCHGKCFHSSLSVCLSVCWMTCTFLPFDSTVNTIQVLQLLLLLTWSITKCASCYVTEAHKIARVPVRNCSSSSTWPT